MVLVSDHSLPSLSHLDRLGEAARASQSLGYNTVRYEQASAISERHRSILCLIRDGDSSSRSLAEQLGVSEPTINRDIEFLREQGYRIKAVRVDRRWAYRLIDDMAKENAAIASRGNQG